MKIILLLLPITTFSQQGKLDSLKQALQVATTDSVRYSLSSELIRNYTESNSDSALFYAEQCLLLAEKYNRKLDEASILDVKGYILMKLGKAGESLKCFLNAVKIAEDPANEGNTWYQYKNFGPHQMRLYILANVHHGWGHLMGSVDVE